MINKILLTMLFGLVMPYAIAKDHGSGSSLLSNSATSAEVSNAQENAKIQEYHLCLDVKGHKLKALTIQIPSKFREGVRIEDDPAGSLTFINKSDPLSNWSEVTENISITEHPTSDVLGMLYGSCFSTAKIMNLDDIIDHKVEFSHEDGVCVGVSFFDRPSVAYRVKGGGYFGPSNNELIFYKVYQGRERVIAVQYVKRYDLSISPEKKKELIQEAKDLFNACSWVADFGGKEKRIDGKVKTVSVLPKKATVLVEMPE